MRANSLPADWSRFILEADEVRLIHMSPPKCPPPEPDDEILETLTDEEDYHLYELTGGPVETSVLAMEGRKAVLDAINRSIAEGENFSRCFYPHHFLEAQTSEQVLRLSICFECSLIWSRFNGARRESFVISNFAEALFNDYFPKPAIAFTELERRISKVGSEVRQYTMRFPGVVKRLLPQIEELETEVRATPDLKNPDALLANLQEMRDHFDGLPQGPG